MAQPVLYPSRSAAGCSSPNRFAQLYGDGATWFLSGVNSRQSQTLRASLSSLTADIQLLLNREQVTLSDSEQPVLTLVTSEALAIPGNQTWRRYWQRPDSVQSHGSELLHSSRADRANSSQSALNLSDDVLEESESFRFGPEFEPELEVVLGEEKVHNSNPASEETRTPQDRQEPQEVVAQCLRGETQTESQMLLVIKLPASACTVEKTEKLKEIISSTCEGKSDSFKSQPTVSNESVSDSPHEPTAIGETEPVEEILDSDWSLGSDWVEVNFRVKQIVSSV